MAAGAKGKQQKQVRQLQCQEQCIDHIPYYLSGLSRAHFSDTLSRSSCVQYFFYSVSWYIQHSCIVLIRLPLRKRENSILDQINDPCKMHWSMLITFATDNFQHVGHLQCLIPNGMTHCLFCSVQAEYSREGLDWSPVDFVDNREVVETLANKPLNCFALMDEESRFPQVQMLLAPI